MYPPPLAVNDSPFPSFLVGFHRRFLATSTTEVLGELVRANDRDLEAEQKHAWEEELRLLHDSLAGFTGSLHLEFNVPRLGSRIDAVVIAGPAIFPLEFKCGERAYRRADVEQA